MKIGKPYRFKLYFQDDEEVARIRAAGLEPTRVANNDGSVPIAGTDEDGEWATIAYVLPRASRKRNTPYDAPDPERDALAELIVAALNAYEGDAA